MPEGHSFQISKAASEAADLIKQYTLRALLAALRDVRYVISHAFAKIATAVIAGLGGGLPQGDRVVAQTHQILNDVAFDSEADMCGAKRATSAMGH